jgi:alkanesulfonate monooxygenase SsuD/methylene tetrahydromethanopterin reductase-like flavin-dependent oxidoreductase (luciferase family)
MDRKVMRFGWSAQIGQGAGTAMEPASWFQPDLYASMLRLIEAAGVEFALLAETRRPTLNPMMLAGALSSTTSRIGIVPVMPMTDYPPFKLSRLLTTLNHMTRGRIGWGMDTSVTQRGAYHYGMAEGPPEMLRHKIAAEYVEVCEKLWNSWAPGAVVQNFEAGIFADADKVKAIHHDGTYFKVRGPLNTTNQPYARPLIVQAVSGDDELRFAARHADLAIISGAEAASLANQRTALQSYAEAQGRDPATLRTYFSVAPQLGDTASGRAGWPAHPRGGLTLAGALQSVVAQLEQIFDESRCDGVVIEGVWSSVQVNLVCNQLLGLLRRGGRLAPRSAAGGLLDSVLG